MNKDKKIAVQQQIINELTEQKDALTTKVADLEVELNFERNKINLGYEKAKELIKSLETQVEFYNTANAELKEAKKEYEKALKDVARLRKKYSKDIEAVIKTVKKRK